MQPAQRALNCDEGERLVSVDAAFSQVTGAASRVAGVERLPLAQAIGRVVVEDVCARIPLPPFDQSAVDGYGLTSADVDRSGKYTLRLAGRIAAGTAINPVSVKSGQAVRLFTGAVVPPEIAAVVLEERCFPVPEAVVIGVPVPTGANIRKRGEDVAAGSVIVEAGTRLDARHIAILAAAGLPEVLVSRRVRVAIVSTGDELRAQGDILEPGAIYDSNRAMLGALMASPAIDIVDAVHVPDGLRVLASRLYELATSVDIVVATGGAAGSDTDHTARAILAAGGEARSLRVALRPGKPMVVGRIGTTYVIGLPGNPVAALVNVLLFARPLLSALAGARPEPPRGQPATTVAPIVHAEGRTEFAPARVVGFGTDGRPSIEKIGKGGSARLRPLVLADGLAEVPSSVGSLAAGDPLVFHPFHGSLSP
jgi:molybdopterin molybdotransferase